MTDRKIVIALTEDHHIYAAALASEGPFNLGRVIDIGKECIMVEIPISEVRMSTHILERVKRRDDKSKFQEWEPMQSEADAP